MSPAQFKAARLALGMTQGQLATALGLGKSGDRTIRRWENGERKISGPVARAIEALNWARAADKTT